MNEQRRQILEMLADGKITADEAERLIDAVDQEPPGSPPPADGRPRSRPKYMRVLVNGGDETGNGPSTVNVRVPLQLLRAGIRLTSLLPPLALLKINEELEKKGVPIDLTQLKPEQLEELVDLLDEVVVDVDDPSGKVRVFCE